MVCIRWIQALVHISTAYANCDRQYIEEIVYPPPLSPAKVVSAVEWVLHYCFLSVAINDDSSVP